MIEDSGRFDDFPGVARLFPLPNLVLFPHVAQPLHVFEPRYRQMTKDALEDNRLIAIVLLQPGWEPDYEGRPEVHPIACLGRILTDQRLPDGKYNLMLRGLCRLKLGKEVPDTKLYRSAQAMLLPDPLAIESAKLRQMLLEETERWLPKQGPFADQFEKLFQSKLALGSVCDIVSFALPISVELKQSLLAELDIEQRVRRLIHELQTNSPPEMLHAPRISPYPAEFSSN